MSVAMANKQHLHKLLSDAIPLLCRNGLPPSVSFRVEALIGITVVDDQGRDVVGEGNVTVLSFQQTVSDSGVMSSQFGSNDPTSAVSDVGSTLSHTPRKRPTPKKAAAASFSVKQEYAVETSVKQEYGADSYLPYATGRPPVDSTLEEYGTEDGAEVEYLDEEGNYIGDEEYYEDDGQYYDDGSGYPSDVKLEAADNSYMEDAGVGLYMQTEYMSEDYEGQLSAGRPLKNKAAKPRLSAAGAQPGTSRGRKPGGTGRGGTRPRGGRTSQDQATALALAAGATGSSNQRGMLTNLARTIADQSEVASKFFCHICNACLSSKTSLVTHIKGSHLAASMFTCDQCGAGFKWYMQLHRHRRRFHGDDRHSNSSDYHGNEYEPASASQ